MSKHCKWSRQWPMPTGWCQTSWCNLFSPPPTVDHCAYLNILIDISKSLGPIMIKLEEEEKQTSDTDTRTIILLILAMMKLCSTRILLKAMITLPVIGQ